MLRNILILSVVLVAGACNSTLETGYEPKRLNASDSERKAYYAQEFTPESQPTKDKGAMPDLTPPQQ